MERLLERVANGVVGAERYELAALLSKTAAKAEGEAGLAAKLHVLCLPPPRQAVTLATLPKRAEVHRPDIGAAKAFRPVCSQFSPLATDPVLKKLGRLSTSFVDWLGAEEPLVKAYASCILANIAFIEEGQEAVFNAGGITPLLSLLREHQDTKVRAFHKTAISLTANAEVRTPLPCHATTHPPPQSHPLRLMWHLLQVKTHATAAIQNLTFKNAACCASVLQARGDKLLKRLLSHSTEDVAQFAAGAIANLQLYRGADDASRGERIKKNAGCGGPSTNEQTRAATSLQAVWRGHRGRRW